LVTVIGGAWFIGTELCKQFVDNNTEFRVLDKKETPEYGEHGSVADVSLKEELLNAELNGTSIVNLAAEHRDDVRPLTLYDQVNVEGARHVCDLARKNEIRKIVFTSSVAVYGFAPVGTDESGDLNPFNDYGRTKAEAEDVYRAWQMEDPKNRMLVIIRPTVVFGEGNRGNVYNLLRQIATGKFLMIGNGKNRKSMAYVENVAAFIVHSLSFGPGVHVYNYVDKPDLSMNELVSMIRSELGRGDGVGLRILYWLGYSIAKFADLAAFVTRRSFPISSIRVKKFCSDTMFGTSVADTGFVPPVALNDALRKTIRHEVANDRSEAE
jgi:nucleoside-diphosphate-sugar epimerase